MLYCKLESMLRSAHSSHYTAADNGHADVCVRGIDYQGCALPWFCQSGPMLTLGQPAPTPNDISAGKAIAIATCKSVHNERSLAEGIGR